MLFRSGRQLQHGLNGGTPSHVDQLIQTLGLREHVRIIGFAAIEKFVDYMGACDIILNLRYPTVGETSGTLLRSLGMGKPVMISEIGAFSEYPDEICLKVPVGAGEEDLIFEYLNLLVSRYLFSIGMPLERWRPVENWPDQKAVLVDVLYTLLSRVGLLPLVSFVPPEP